MKSVAMGLWVLLLIAPAVCAQSPTTRPFDYTPIAADASVFDTKPDGALLRQRLSIAGADQQRIPIAITLPAQGRKPFPVVILLHGAFDDRKENLSRAYGWRFAKFGVATVAIDLPGHGQRQGKDHDEFRSALGYLLSQRIAPNLPLAPLVSAKDRAAIEKAGPQAGQLVADGFADCVIDARRVIDYVQTRPELDGAQVAVLGQSMGGSLAFWLTAADPRVRASVLTIAGAFELPDDAQSKPLQAFYDPAALTAYAQRIAPRPVLMLSSKNDPLVSVADTNRLFNSLQEPRRIEWYQAGHNLPRPGFDEAAAWLAMQFGIKQALTTQPATLPAQ